VSQQDHGLRKQSGGGKCEAAKLRSLQQTTTHTYWQDSHLGKLWDEYYGERVVKGLVHGKIEAQRRRIRLSLLLLDMGFHFFGRQVVIAFDSFPSPYQRSSCTNPWLYTLPAG
jgi:hypothetical protein